MDALLRAKKEAVYRRRLTDAEWTEKRPYSSDKIDIWIVSAIARVALECAIAIAERQDSPVAESIRPLIAELERSGDDD